MQRLFSRLKDDWAPDAVFAVSVVNHNVMKVIRNWLFLTHNHTVTVRDLSEEDKEECNTFRTFRCHKSTDIMCLTTNNEFAPWLKTELVACGLWNGWIVWDFKTAAQLRRYKTSDKILGLSFYEKTVIAVSDCFGLLYDQKENLTFRS